MRTATTRTIAALSASAALAGPASADIFDLTVDLEYTSASQRFTFDPGMDQSFTFDPPETNTISGRYQTQAPSFDSFGGFEFYSLVSDNTGPVTITEGPGLLGTLGTISTMPIGFVRMEASSTNRAGRSPEAHGFVVFTG